MNSCDDCRPFLIRDYVHVTRLQFIGHYPVLLNYQDLAHLSRLSMSAEAYRTLTRAFARHHFGYYG